MIIDWLQHKYEGHIKFLGLTKFGSVHCVEKVHKTDCMYNITCFFIPTNHINCNLSNKIFHSFKTSMNGKLHVLSKHIILGSSLI